MTTRRLRAPAALSRRRVVAGPEAAALAVLSALPLAGGLVACRATTPVPDGPDGHGGAGVIEGTVTYRERVALSPEALLEIALFDVTRPDPRDRPIAKQLYAGIGQVPLRFAFAYEPDAIAPDRSYVLLARILEGEQPVFLTTRPVPVLTGGADATAELMLARAGGRS